VWWKILRSFVGNIHPQFSSERILKIGYDLRKLLPKVSWLPFLGTRCILVKMEELPAQHVALLSASSHTDPALYVVNAAFLELATSAQ